jgi:hypothetical protein
LLKLFIPPRRLESALLPLLESGLTAAQEIDQPKYWPQKVEQQEAHQKARFLDSASPAAPASLGMTIQKMAV